MWKIIPYALLQALLMTSVQVMLKYALIQMPPFSWTMTFFSRLLTNWQFAASGLFFCASSLLWMHMLRHFPLSTAYPMLSLSYVFGMGAAIVFFHEEVSLLKCIGVLFIVIGCLFIAK